MPTTPIHRIQGPSFFSPLSGQTVTTRGVVTGATRKGFFIQDPEGDVGDTRSHGIFVFDRHRRAPIGALVEICGEVEDYCPEAHSRPTTQIIERSTRLLQRVGPPIETVWLTAQRVLVDRDRLAAGLNRLEGMLVGVEAGATFVAPSNPFGDYVVLPPGADLARTEHGGVRIDPEQPERWLPGFRVLDYDHAPTVDVGATLKAPVVGPLNYRVASYQIAAVGRVEVVPARAQTRPTQLRGGGRHVTVLTLNGLNLDVKREDPARVHDPGRDVDDDLADGRFHGLGWAIVREAACPAIVALQEIQDNDGAELSDEVRADKTYAALISAVRLAGGPTYAWADIPPQSGADGGQPGGNIRNAFLYDPKRVELVPGSLALLGAHHRAFEGSRKPLTARFRLCRTGGELEVVNVHLASKRHQHGLFDLVDPGVDAREELRVAQAEVIGAHLAQLRQQEVDYYVTGDFNDFEFSRTLRTLTGEHSVNLVDGVPEPLRYDYNHRGLSQALMHGVVARRQLQGRSARYEILHANAIEGTPPGRPGAKPSDHAYVVARLELR